MFLLRISWEEACGTQHTTNLNYMFLSTGCAEWDNYTLKNESHFTESAELSAQWRCPILWMDVRESQCALAQGMPWSQCLIQKVLWICLCQVPALWENWQSISKMDNCSTQSFWMSQWTSHHIIFICSWPLVWFYVTEALLQALLWCRSHREGCGCCLGEDSSRLQLLTGLMLHLTPVLLQTWLGVPPKSTDCKCTVSARKTLIMVYQFCNNVMGVWAGQWCWDAGSPEMECWL